MHFQIYLPGVTNAVAPELEKAGLGDFVASAEAMPCPNGPDGKDGAIFAWRNAKSRQIGYRPDAQTWIPSPCGRHWSGLWNDAPPTPDELVIGQDAGIRMPLGDGHSWLMPSLLRLDKVLTIGTDGIGRMETPKKFRVLVDEQMRWTERLANADTFSLTESMYWEWFEIAAMALRINYRITREVVGGLNLFSMETVMKAFNVIVGTTLGMVDPNG